MNGHSYRKMGNLVQPQMQGMLYSVFTKSYTTTVSNLNFKEYFDYNENSGLFANS